MKEKKNTCMTLTSNNETNQKGAVSCSNIYLSYRNDFNLLT